MWGEKLSPPIREASDLEKSWGKNPPLRMEKLSPRSHTLGPRPDGQPGPRLIFSGLRDPHRAVPRTGDRWDLLPAWSLLPKLGVFF